MKSRITPRLDRDTRDLLNNYREGKITMDDINFALLSDMRFLYHFLSDDIDRLLHLPEGLREDRAVRQLAVELGAELHMIDDKFFCDKEIILKSIQNSGFQANLKEFAMLCLGLKGDEELVKQAIVRDSSTFVQIN